MGATRGTARVRASRDEDLDAVAAIYSHHVLHGNGSFELEVPTVEELGQRRAEVRARDLPYLVVEEAGVLAGYAYANVFRPRPAYRFSVEDSIYLDPAYTGRGLGTLLLRELLVACTEWGARQMIAVIGDSANVASIALHARCGFRFAGILHATGWKHGRWLDTVLMQAALGPGNLAPGIDIGNTCL
jgi:phosphinothricin acetyltransferase